MVTRRTVQEDNMDTKALTVGQEVYMFSGCYMNKGKVVTITSLGVDVQTNDGLVHFDKNGCSFVTEPPPS